MTTPIRYDAACKARQESGWQGPTNGQTASSYGDLYLIVTHPAFRIGFMDALAKKPLNHDKIADRIIAETPPRAFVRMGIATESLFEATKVEPAQYRYEEGRIAVIQEGLRCKAWGHPDFPPAAVREYIWNRADKTIVERSPDEASVTPVLRAASLPLFAGLPA
jgi:hypothetical protein